MFVSEPVSKLFVSPRFLGVDSPCFSTVGLTPTFSLGFWRFSRKKDPWKEWGIEGTPRRLHGPFVSPLYFMARGGNYLFL